MFDFGFSKLVLLSLFAISYINLCLHNMQFLFFHLNFKLALNKIMHNGFYQFNFFYIISYCSTNQKRYSNINFVFVPTFRNPGKAYSVRPHNLVHRFVHIVVVCPCQVPLLS